VGLILLSPGNILGSNIYNTLGIGGVTALIAPTGVPREIATFDNFVVVAISIILLVMARPGWRIWPSRWFA
jgi:cation:H+ antiporter